MRAVTFDARLGPFEDVRPSVVETIQDDRSTVPHLAAPAGLRFEHRTDDGPVLGIGTGAPRLSWVLPTADASFVQEAYEVEVCRDGRDPAVVRVTSGEQ